jgi:hypothetical protein
MSANDELEHYMASCSRLKAENARLQERVEEAEQALLAGIDLAAFYRNERDCYKALAERRKVTLDAGWPFLWHTKDCVSVVGQVASGHPCDCGFTGMIELVKEVRGSVC